MGLKTSLGTILQLTGAAILASAYVAANVLNGGRADQFRFMLDMKTKVASGVTGMNLKVLASSNGVTYTPIMSQDEGTLAPALVQTWAVAAAGTPQQQSVLVPGGYPYLKVLIEATGADGAAGGSGVAIDQMTLTAQAI